MRSCSKNENYAVYLENEIHEGWHIHPDLELIYVIEGELNVKLSGESSFTLGAEDVMLVNVHCRHFLQSVPAGIYCRIFFKSSWFFEGAGISSGYYRCVSCHSTEEKYERLRAYVREVLRAALQGKGPALFLNGFVSLTAGFIHENFCVSAPFGAEKGNENSIRDQMILNYLEKHYSEPVTLEALADQVHLSRTYLSRYFRRAFAMTLREYLSEIRLKYAADDVIHTKKTVLQIAVDNGFASPAALDRRFMERFGMLPSAYRKKYKSSGDKKYRSSGEKKDKSSADKKDKSSGEIKARKDGEGAETIKPSHDGKTAKMLCMDGHVSLPEPALAFLEGYLQPGEEKNMVKSSIFSGDAQCAKSWQEPWNKVINGGSLKDMLASRLQNHLLTLHNHLRFTYVRFWNIFVRHGSPEANANGVSREESDTYSYDALDSVIDFLLEHDMKPFIDLGTKVSAVRKNTADMTEKTAWEPPYPLPDIFMEELLALLVHLSGRYGTREVSLWYFELWNPWEAAQMYQSYGELFLKARAMIKSYFPGSLVGGSGMHLNENAVPDLKQWAEMEVLPDFLSFYYFPYDEQGVHMEKGSAHARDEDDFEHQLDRMSKAMARLGLGAVPMYVTEWGMSVSDRNFFNDSCLKGAYIVKSMIAAVGPASLAAYWSASDLTSDYYDFVHLLGGGQGLLTKDGIAKPAYYAFEFLGKLGQLLIGKNKNAIVTANGLNSFYILCHNHKAFNYKYGLKDESTVRIEELDDYMADQAPLKLHFHVDHINNGTYLYRKSRMTDRQGSVIYEWGQYSFMDNLRREDIQHLRTICTPQIVSRRFHVSHGCLELDVELEANEIAYIHIYPE